MMTTFNIITCTNSVKHSIVYVRRCSHVLQFTDLKTYRRFLAHPVHAAFRTSNNTPILSPFRRLHGVIMDSIYMKEDRVSQR